MSEGQKAQEAFLATFPKGYTPKIDVRTPADLKREKAER